MTAVFHDARLSFDMARETTLEELAEQLCRLGETHGGPPLSVAVRVPVERAH
ncbi:MAG: hypothetical protein WA633_05260 [Stellaceae bacterium]